MRNHSGSLSRDICQQTIGEVIRNLTDSTFQLPSPSASTSRAETVVLKDDEEKGAGTEGEMNTAPSSQGEGTSENGNAGGGSPTCDNAAISAGSGAQQDAGSELPKIADILPKLDPLPSIRPRARVDLKHPKYTILISALKGVAGLSVVTEWDTSKKFNLQMLAEEQLAKKGEAARADAQNGTSKAEEKQVADEGALSGPAPEETRDNNAEPKATQ